DRRAPPRARRGRSPPGLRRRPLRRIRRAQAGRGGGPRARRILRGRALPPPPRPGRPPPPPADGAWRDARGAPRRRLAPARPARGARARDEARRRPPPRTEDRPLPRSPRVARARPCPREGPPRPEPLRLQRRLLRFGRAR